MGTFARASYEKRLGDEYRPSALRFKVYTNEKAVLIYSEAHPVKKISLGGLLIETGYSIQTDKMHPMGLFLPNGYPLIKFRGRIASFISIQNKELQRFDIGIEFIHMAENGKSRLEKFLQFYAGTR